MTPDTEKELLEFINSNTILFSLLYDLDLLPEQFERETARWFKMLNIAAHFKQALEEANRGIL